MNETPGRLPLTVISGYLGAGKTTLINQLLRRADGRRIMVLVNDFGSINIDADLLESADEDTLSLTNGCVCCTMGADLFMALGDALDRRPRPDFLVIEASGVADPAKIAEAAKAEPDLSYGGVVTVVDGLNYAATSQDPLIGHQVRGQVAVADLLLIAKGGDVTEALRKDSAAPVLRAEDHPDLTGLLFEHRGNAHGHGHAHYTQWSYQGPAEMTREALLTHIDNRPEFAYRAKGFVRDVDTVWEVQAVGATIEIRRGAGVPQTSLVMIGPAAAFKAEDADEWWAGRPI